MACTRPIFPSVNLTLIPCGWKEEFVRISFTTPTVLFPVFWSAFKTISTVKPDVMSFLF